MHSKLRLLPGAILLLLGAVAVATSARILSTFLLDLVAGSISKKPISEIGPYDYSWGTMEWGTMGADFPVVVAGLVLIAIGQFLVFPATVRRLRSWSDPKPPVLPKLALIGAALLTALATASFLLVPVLTKSAFGVLATTGVADPVQFGEDLPVRSCQVFMVTLVGAQVLMLVAAFAAPSEKGTGSHRVATFLAFAACACFLLFTLGIVTTYLGPIRSMHAILGVPATADPTVLAEKISLGLNLMIMVAPLLGVSAVLSLLAAVVPGRRSA